MSRGDPQSTSELMEREYEAERDDLRRRLSHCHSEDEALEALREAGGLGAGLAMLRESGGWPDDR